MNIVGYKSTQKNGTKTYMSEIVVKKEIYKKSQLTPVMWMALVQRVI